MPRQKAAALWARVLGSPECAASSRPALFIIFLQFMPWITSAVLEGPNHSPLSQPASSGSVQLAPFAWERPPFEPQSQV